MELEGIERLSCELGEIDFGAIGPAQGIDHRLGDGFDQLLRRADDALHIIGVDCSPHTILSCFDRLTSRWWKIFEIAALDQAGGSPPTLQKRATGGAAP